MSRAPAAAPAQTTGRPAPKPATGYFHRSEMPLTSLAFVLPLVVMYEIGTRYFFFDPMHHAQQRIIAFTFMQQFFGWFGATGRYLPAMSIVGILLAWHIARNDSWHVDPRHLLVMAIESCALAVPLISIGIVAARYLPMTAIHEPPSGALVLSLGAGIYEELVFRLIAFTLLSVLFIDVLQLRKLYGYGLMILISSLLFSLYHYLGYETFQWRTFAFRTAAGFYFGLVFAFRGFGVTSGTHAAYDIIVLTLRSVS